MTTDEKIDELLRIVQGHGARFDRLEARFDRSDGRFDQLEKRDDELFQLIREEADRSQARDGELLKLIVEQRDSFEEERKLTRDRFAGVEHQIKGLHTKFDKFQETVSADLQAFSEDLYKL
jgi:hypothetical protein